jgi:hypothetical protein
MAERQRRWLIVEDFKARKEPIVLDELRDFKEAIGLACRLHVGPGHFDLFSQKAIKDTFSDGRFFLLDGCEDDVGDMRIELGKDLFATPGKTKDVAGTPRTLSHPDVGDETLGFESEQVLAHRTCGEVSVTC